MSLRYKLAGAAIGIGLLISTTACVVVEDPYKLTNAADLKLEASEQITVEGTPFLLRKDLSFMFKSNGREFFVERGRNDEINGFDELTGNTGEAYSALEKEISDGDQETIKIMGNFAGDKTIKARYLQIEGSLYPVYK